MDCVMENLSRQIGLVLMRRGCTVGCAESCTGGNIAASLTAVPGSSAYFKGSVVAYAAEVKTSLLGVNPQTLACEGVVSRQTVCEMVAGALKALRTDYAVATTGVAGPGGGTDRVPVGTIWIAAGSEKKMVSFCQTIDKGREANVERATRKALEMLLELLQSYENDSKG